ncbi:MAG: hypothetical protein JO300_15950, partial [Silvibacterium sp.]|nr:hypothetical protein [Silvibacterium sp.]
YLECSHLDDHGQPVGEIVNWDQIRFPFDPPLRGYSDLSAQPIAPLQGNDLRVREEYTCDASGNLRVRISADPAGYEREFSIAQAGN